MNLATGLIDFRLLFAAEEEQIRFVRNGIAGVSGQALKNVMEARKIILSLLSRRMGSTAFSETFSSLEHHPLFSNPGLSLLENVQDFEKKARAQWGSDLLVALGTPASKDNGRLLFFNLIESETWQVSPFHEGDINIVEQVLEKRLGATQQRYRLELAMAPFGLPDDEFQVSGCSWMLPLALASHNKQGGFVMGGQYVFSGCLDKNEQVNADKASSLGKWKACSALGVKALFLPHTTYGRAPDLTQVNSFSNALTVNESVNIFNIEGKTDRQVVSALRKSRVSQRDWSRTLPIARLFYKKLCNESLQQSHPATFDYAQRLLASCLLHTGHAEEAHGLMNNILKDLKDKDVSHYLHLDIFENGDEWLRYAFDYFFTESTVLSKLGMNDEALAAIDERLEDLENTTQLMKQALGLQTSHRLDYSWVKGIFTKVICLIERSVIYYDVASLHQAWELCQNSRYHRFFETFLGMPQEELPPYLTVEGVIRSFNYTVDVAFELHDDDQLTQDELSAINVRRQRILEHWGEQPHDLFFGISCLKIDKMLKKCDPQRAEHYREFFWNFRDSSFYSLAETVMERMNFDGQEEVNEN